MSDASSPTPMEQQQTTTAPQQQSPDPLMVGKRFVKQYYKVLSTTPEQIHRFYQPASLLSHAEGNTLTSPVPLSDAVSPTNANNDNTESSSNTLKDRFFLNVSQPQATTDSVVSTHIRFEFEHGAIDAQPTMNDGILLVATGQVVYTFACDDDDGVSIVLDETRKSFVHTFFLNHSSLSTKRFYYVHNDILRFLYQPKPTTSAVEPPPVNNAVAEDIPVTSPASEVTMEPEIALVPVVADEVAPIIDSIVTDAQEPLEKSQDIKDADLLTSSIELTIAETVPATTEIVPEAISEVLPVPIIASDDVKVDEAPGGGVEESKDEQNNVPVDNAADGGTNDMEGDNLEILKERGLGAAAESTYKENRSGGRGRGGRSSGNNAGKKTQAQVSKPVPGSWASLVAGGGGGGSTPSAVKQYPPKQEKNLAADTSNTQPQIQPTSTFDVKSDSKDANEVTGSTSNSVGGGGNRDSSGDGGNRSSARDRSSARGGKDGNRDGGRPSRDKFHHHQRAPKRDPDCTLVIKNLADNTREADVLALFEPFAQSNNSKIVGITVSAHRGIAFVDYDNVTPVLKAVAEHKNEKMTLQGRALEVDQKTAEQRARRAQRGNSSYGSGTPGNNGGAYRGRGHHGGRRGGRGGDHRGNGGRGGRGSGGGGGSGTR